MSSFVQDRDSRHSSLNHQRVGSFSSASPPLAPSVSTSFSSPPPAPDSDSNSNTGATLEKPAPEPDRGSREQVGLGEQESSIEGRVYGREEEDEEDAKDEEHDEDEDTEHNVVADEIRKVIALAEAHGCVATGQEKPSLYSAETENSSLSWQDVDEHTWRNIQAVTRLNRTRWDYCPSRRLLRIRMPTAVHDEFIQTVGSHISEQFRNALDTHPEPAVSARTLRLPGSTTIFFPNGSERSPDFSLSVSDSATTFPSIVFENDFSSGGDDLDCLNFIKRSSGHIRTVVAFRTQYHKPTDRLSSAGLSPPTINLYRLVPIPGREGIYRPRKVVDNVVLQHGRTLDFQLSDLLHLGSRTDISIPIQHSYMLNTWTSVVGLQHRIDSEKQNSHGKRPRNEEFALECSSSDSDGDAAAYKPPKKVIRPSKRNRLHD